jgi:hypothetical protein
MTVIGLLAAIRARVAARGMTFTQLAHASGVQPGNLRRMLTSTTASPRLGSVMRLLPPLHCRIGPAGASTAVELAAFLEDRRRSSALPWEQLLGPAGSHAGKVAARLGTDPELMSMEMVMRLADALHIEFELVDDAEALSPDGRSTKRRARATRRGATMPEALPAPTLPRDRSAPLIAPVAGVATPVAVSATPMVAAVSPAARSGLAPLRPPRLGRYRDAPSEPTPERPRPAPWTPSTEPYALESALASRLASLSSEDWSAGFAATCSVFASGVTLPASFLDGLGRWTAAAFQRLRRPPGARRPPTPEPPDGCLDALDPWPLVHGWTASRQPGYCSTDTNLTYDALGILAIHLAFDGKTAVVVRLAPRGFPHRLIQIFRLPRHDADDAGVREEVLLGIRVGGAVHSFSHVRAGPVFGELIIGERAYLLAAVSSLLVVVETHANEAHVVWGGRAERLCEVDIAKPVEVERDMSASIEVAGPAVEERFRGESAENIARKPEVGAEQVDHSTQDNEQRSARADPGLPEVAQEVRPRTRSVFDLESRARTITEHQVQLAIAESQAAEVRAAQAEQARDALSAEVIELRAQLAGLRQDHSYDAARIRTLVRARCVSAAFAYYAARLLGASIEDANRLADQFVSEGEHAASAAEEANGARVAEERGGGALGSVQPADAAPAEVAADVPADAADDAPAEVAADVPADAADDAPAEVAADGPDDALADGPADVPGDTVEYASAGVVPALTAEGADCVDVSPQVWPSSAMDRSPRVAGRGSEPPAADGHTRRLARRLERLKGLAWHSRYYRSTFSFRDDGIEIVLESDPQLKLFPSTARVLILQAVSLTPSRVNLRGTFLHSSGRVLSSFDWTSVDNMDLLYLKGDTLNRLFDQPGEIGGEER